MKNGKVWLGTVVFLLWSFLVLNGCTTIGSALLIGGKVVKNYTPGKIVITYVPEGSFPEGSQFFLIETEEGLAVLQQDRDGLGVIYKKHWTEGESDYFSAAFFGNGPAYIFKVPFDRSKEAGRYVYEHGTYQGTPGDRIRPMPYKPKPAPDTRLLPQKAA